MSHLCSNSNIVFICVCIKRTFAYRGFYCTLACITKTDILIYSVSVSPPPPSFFFSIFPHLFPAACFCVFLTNFFCTWTRTRTHARENATDTPRDRKGTHTNKHAPHSCFYPILRGGQVRTPKIKPDFRLC